MIKKITALVIDIDSPIPLFIGQEQLQKWNVIHVHKNFQMYMGDNVRVKQAYFNQLPPLLHHISTWSTTPSEESVRAALQKAKQNITDMLPPKLTVDIWDTSIPISLETLQKLAREILKAVESTTFPIIDTGSNDFALFREAHLDLFKRKKLMIEDFKDLERLHKALSLFQVIYQQKLIRAGMANFRAIKPEFTLEGNPVIQRPSLYPIEYRKEVHKNIQDLLDRRVYTKLAPGEVARNITRLNAVKEANKYRMVQDLVPVNWNVVKTIYPLMTTDEAFNFLLDYPYRFIIDAVSSFHQFKLDPSVRTRFAATSSHTKVMIPQVLVMGMKGASEFVQHFHDIMLEPANAFIKAFMDDFHAGASTVDEAMNRIIIFHILTLRYHIFIKPSKMQVFQKETFFLGKLLKGKNLHIPPECIQKVRNWQVRTVKQLKTFIGFITYFSHHLPRWSDVRAPLDNAIKHAVPGKPLVLKEVDEAVRQAKELFLNYHSLQCFKQDQQIIIDFDYSGRAVAIAIFQIPSEMRRNLIEKKQLRNQERLIAFYSKKVPEHISKQGPSSTKGEAHAYQIALKKAYPFLIRSIHPPIVRSDSRGLILLMQSKNLIAPYFRGIRTLSQLHGATFLHQSSEHQIVTDFMSRVMSSSTPERKVKDIQLYHIDSKQSQDPRGEASSPPRRDSSNFVSFINDIDWKDHYANSKFEKMHRKLRCTSNRSGPFRLVGPVLMNEDDRILTPPSVLPIIFTHYHSDSLGASHAGVNQLYAIISKKFKVPYLMDGLLKLTAKCQICQKTNPGRSSMARESTLREGMIPMSVISLDTIQFQKDLSHLGEGVLVASCVLTKFVIFALLKDFKAMTIVGAITDTIIAVHGPPRQIITDKATYFSSTEFAVFAKSFDIEISITLARAHSANPVERRIRDIRKVFRVLNLKNPKRGTIGKSDLLLVAYGMNSQIHPRFGISSYELVFGRNPNSIFRTNPIPIDLSSNLLDEYLTKYIEWIHGNLKIQREVIQHQLSDHIADLKLARQLQSTKVIPNLATNEWIYIRNFSQIRNAPRYKGPFRVLATRGNAVYLYMTVIMLREAKPAPLILRKKDFIVALSDSNALMVGRVIGTTDKSVSIHTWHRTEKNPLQGPYRPAFIDSRDNTIMLTARSIRPMINYLKPITQQCSLNNIWAVNCIANGYVRHQTLNTRLCTFIKWKQGNIPTISHIPNSLLRK